MSLRYRFCAGLIAMVLMANPGAARAQKEQTPETAQEFLQVTSGNAAIRFRMETGEQTRNQYSTMRFVGIYDSNTCTSRLTGALDYEYLGISRRWERLTNSNFEYPIYWNLISKVTRYGRDVRLDWSNGVSPIVLTYPTEDLSTRATFAMEFLRAACDPTAGLAF